MMGVPAWFMWDSLQDVRTIPSRMRNAAALISSHEKKQLTVKWFFLSNAVFVTYTAIT